jgi:glycosyltransferase involved in cell wall biosynthesis
MILMKSSHKINYNISIIIPTYNAESFLEDTVNFLTKQSIGFKNLEILIVDDNSKDNTKKIIERLSNKHKNIFPIFLQENHGAPGIPRNIGIENAKSKYIMFLDQDDKYERDICKLLYETISCENVDFVGCDYQVKVGKYIKHDKNYLAKKYGLNIRVNSINELSGLNTAMLDVYIWNKIFKKEFLEKNNIDFIEGLYEDNCFMIQVYSQSMGFILRYDFIGYTWNRYETKSASILYTQENTIKFLNGLKELSKIIKNYDIDYSPHFDQVFAEFTGRYLRTNFSKEDNKIVFVEAKKLSKLYNNNGIFGKGNLFNIFANTLINTFYQNILLSKLLTKIVRTYLKLK